MFKQIVFFIGVLAMAEAGTKYAVVGGGCFWCVEAVFERLDGVKSAVSGYAGGSSTNPTYEEVSYKNTGHAEVVRIEYDGSRLDYRDILEVFFKTHDPTALNHQGADVGEQYRSVIFYGTSEEKAMAEALVAELAPEFDKPIVTEISKLDKFYLAEAYHQDYYEKNPSQPYCSFVIAPKLEKLKFTFEKALKEPYR